MRAAGLVLALLAGPALAADPLPPVGLSAEPVTVSGLSSGAYMAVQVHVAHSGAIAGAGVVAGGPWMCAEGSVFTALWSCMETWWGAPDGEALAEMAAGYAADGRIDPLAGLAGDRVYLFRGTEDETVTAPPMAEARDFYLAAGVAPGDLVFRDDVEAGHAFIVEETELECAVTGPPFIADCDLDLAGEILRHLIPGIGARGTADPARLIAFDQSEFIDDPESHGMGPEGFVYVPEACEGGGCRLHIAFAGCRQTVDHIGERFPRETGYNDWAEANGIVVLYPQSHVIPSGWFWPFGGNPKGCWDWWGYDDPDYATKAGRQVRAVAEMATRLGAPGFD